MSPPSWQYWPESVVSGPTLVVHDSLVTPTGGASMIGRNPDTVGGSYAWTVQDDSIWAISGSGTGYTEHAYCSSNGSNSFDNVIAVDISNTDCQVTCNFIGSSFVAAPVGIIAAASDHQNYYGIFLIKPSTNWNVALVQYVSNTRTDLATFDLGGSHDQFLEYELDCTISGSGTLLSGEMRHAGGSVIHTFSPVSISTSGTKVGLKSALSTTVNPSSSGQSWTDFKVFV